MKRILPVIVLLFAGCATHELSLPVFRDGKLIGAATSKIRSFGTNKKLNGLELSYDGMTLRVKGYESDQVAFIREVKEAVIAGGEAAVKAAATGAP